MVDTERKILSGTTLFSPSPFEWREFPSNVTFILSSGSFIDQEMTQIIQKK